MLRHDAAGRPLVEAGGPDSAPLWVSISHGTDLVAVAASALGPVGIDLEQRRHLEVNGLANRWFDPAELAWMTSQHDEAAAFLHLWTAKEAVGKALGKGLRNSGLRRLMPVPVPGVRQGGPLLGGLIPSTQQLALVHLPVDGGAIVAVAVPAGTTSVEVVEYHGAALRRAVVSRTSFPVVVRGN